MATQIITGNNSDPLCQFMTNGAGSTEVARVTLGGNVGIGTTNPTSPLRVHLGTDENFFVQTGENVGGFGAGGINIRANNDANTTDVPFTIAGSKMALITGGVERINILSGGNVGIGTNNARSILDVLNGGTANTAGDVVDAVTIQSGNITNTTNASGNLVIQTNSAFAADVGGSLQFGGRYQAGTAAAGWAGIAGRKTNGTSGDYSGYLAMYTRTTGAAPVERMRIDNAGNVGIGTTSPARLLHVNGIARYKVPAVQVSRSSNQSIPSNTETVISWPSHNFDNDNLHSDTTNPSRLTASEAGIWAIGCNIIWAQGTGSGSRQVTIRKNGGTYIANILQLPTGISGMAVSTISSLIRKRLC